MSLDSDYIRRVLEKTEDQLSDEDIDFYVSRYTKKVLTKVGLTESDLNTIDDARFFFEEAVIAGIGCELVKKNPRDQYIKRQKVGNTEEEFSDALGQLANWCDDYHLALDELLNLNKPTHHVAPFKRKWQSSRRGWYHRF